VGSVERKIRLGRPRSRCEDKIETDFKETGWGDMGLINLAQ
jgi:hypothetical protein